MPLKRADAGDLPFGADLTQRVGRQNRVVAEIVDLVIAVVAVAHDHVGRGRGGRRRVYVLDLNAAGGIGFDREIRRRVRPRQLERGNRIEAARYVTPNPRQQRQSAGVEHRHAMDQGQQIGKVDEHHRGPCLQSCRA